VLLEIYQSFRGDNERRRPADRADDAPSTTDTSTAAERPVADQPQNPER
jgi:hypothetical protein